MAGRTKTVELIEECLIQAGIFTVPATERTFIEVSDYAPNDADREWVARELGDVPHDRICGLTSHDNPMSWAEFRCVVPVESLGRNGDA